MKIILTIQEQLVKALKVLIQFPNENIGESLVSCLNYNCMENLQKLQNELLTSIEPKVQKRSKIQNIRKN